MAAYLIESTIVMALFYLYYIVFLQNKSNYKLSRYYLLGSLFAAHFIPFISINISGTASGIASQIFSSPMYYLDEISVSAAKQGVEFNSAAIFYFGICSVIFLGFAIQLFRLKKLLHYRNY